MFSILSCCLNFVNSVYFEKNSLLVSIVGSFYPDRQVMLIDCKLTSGLISGKCTLYNRMAALDWLAIVNRWESEMKKDGTGIAEIDKKNYFWFKQGEINVHHFHFYGDIKVVFATIAKEKQLLQKFIVCRLKSTRMHFSREIGLFMNFSNKFTIWKCKIHKLHIFIADFFLLFEDLNLLKY